MAHDHWVRMFKIPYRKNGRSLIRDDAVQCEIVKNGMYQPGQKMHIDTETHVTVHAIVPYFDEPKTDEEEDAVDELYARCAVESDEYLREKYPKSPVTSKQ